MSTMENVVDVFESLFEHGGQASGAVGGGDVNFRLSMVRKSYAAAVFSQIQMFLAYARLRKSSARQGRLKFSF